MSYSGGTTFDCRNCEPHHYDAARSVGVYEHALRANVLHLKRVPVVPSILIERMPAIISDAGFGDADLIVPVPLSEKRYVERGFNQAEILARVLSRYTGIPLDPQSLLRKKHTRMHRAGMDRKAREATVENAFEVVRPKLIAGRSILLVDDIFTSGATASYCAKALKRRAAAKVNVFTLARAQSAKAF